MSALRPNHREKAAPKAGGVNGLIDPTKTGKYPVILSEHLMGRTQADVFTSVRYNHKPDLAAEPATARLKPETPGSKANFDLSFPDGNNGMYTYSGTRTMDDNQYVLYFDPNRKAFILDKVDSTFHMNVTRTPSTNNPETLRQQFEQLDTSITATPARLPPGPVASSAKDKSPTKPKGKAGAATTKAKPGPKPRKNTEKKKQEPAVSIQLTLPTNEASPPPSPSKPAAPAPKKKEKAGSDEDEDDDDDFGLTIEYPDENKNKKADFSPAFPAQGVTIRRFSDFLRDSEADDADGESDLEEERDFAFNLPSPVNNQARAGQQHQEAEQEQMDVDSEPDFEDVLEDDLEAELEKELEAANSGDAEESEVSEED
ncbi:hypothetical protein C8035_v009683 [Colletotrichum spinosum]|uniref:Transcription elongation factor Eaf N-terminal domain-containing protein n=1 Tax=Colletotrichum spinosum TaxID=1347390 RepID=A0A4R8Q6R2_9PEZI|nr:hypothetical protein C8035_v009683 [Colletotrichum spinosum]